MKEKYDKNDLTSHRSMGEAIYFQIKADIRNGVLMPGRRLRETELAQRFEVSRTPIREALQLLQADGLLSYGPRGLAVTRISPEEVLSLYGMREILEGAAARFAAENATSFEIENFHRIVDRGSSATKLDENRSLNEEFHNAILMAAHNRYLIETTRVTSDSLLLLGGEIYVDESRLTRRWHEHAKILEAIQRRDPEEAERHARIHVRNSIGPRMSKLFGEAIAQL